MSKLSSLIERVWAWLAGLIANERIADSQEPPPKPEPAGMLSTCLFPPVAGMENTWEFMWPSTSDQARRETVAWLVENRMNCLIFLANELCPNAAEWAQTLWAAGIALIPTLFNDGENEFKRERRAWPERFAEIMRLFDRQAHGYAIGIESNEDPDGYATVKAARAILGSLTRRAIGTHAQWAGGYLPPLDFLLWESGGSPHRGDAKSPAALKDEAKRAMALAGLPFFASEFNTDVAGGRYWEQREALMEIPGVLGVG